ncbi:hypothetical protein JO375_00850 [Paenibacillus sp. UY79]|nr:hypothetical protein [Paenibacillus farraposensis]
MRSIYETAMRYQQDSLIVIAGIDDGMGSSGDRVAEATQILV